MPIGDGAARGFFAVAQGLLGGIREEDERRQLAQERARLQAAAELKDRLTRERQAMLDDRESKQTTFQNGITQARQALDMNKGGFSLYQDGMANGEEAATAQAMPNAAAGPFGGVLGAVAPVVQQRGVDRARTLAGQQGGYVKTAMSEGERIREDDRTARAESLQASLAQARALAQDRISAENQRAQDANSLRRDLANVAASARQAAGTSRADARESALSARLRSQYEQNPSVKQAYTIASQVANIQTAGQRGDPAGDMAMIYSYMKVLDPSSVVRESEYATAKNATGVDERIRNLYNEAVKGNKLNPAQRTQFLQMAQGIAKQARGALQKQNERYGTIAQRAGVDPSLVVYDPFDELDAPAPDVRRDAPAAAPAVASPNASALNARVTSPAPRKPGESIAQYRARTGGR